MSDLNDKQSGPEEQAAADAVVLQESRKHTRRSFAVAAAGAAAGWGLYQWIDRSQRLSMQPKPFRRAFQTNAELARGVFDDRALAPTYPLKRAEDLESGWLASPGGSVLAGGGRRAVRGFVALRCAGLRRTRHGMTHRYLSSPNLAQEAVGRHLGDPLPTIRALLEMLVNGIRRAVVELAQAVGAQGLVGRMRNGMGVHGAVSGDRSSDCF